MKIEKRARSQRDCESQVIEGQLMAKSQNSKMSNAKRSGKHTHIHIQLHAHTSCVVR